MFSNTFTVSIEGEESWYIHPNYSGFPHDVSRAIFGETSSKDKNFALCLIQMPGD